MQGFCSVFDIKRAKYPEDINSFLIYINHFIFVYLQGGPHMIFYI